MRVPRTALLLSLALAVSSAGCIAVARETYTSLRGAGATPVEPRDDFEVSPGRTGHALTHAASLARASFAADASVTAAVCDWDAGVWFIVFPPLPLPLLSLGDSASRPGTTLVRLTLDGPGTWRANLASLALLGDAGRRAAPDQYKLVTKTFDTSLEPCAADVDPRKSIENAELAAFGKAELWLRFKTLDWPETPRALELDGLSLDGVAVRSVRLSFEPGTRWFWYRVFP
ncbi:MAG: hypothetical protein WEF50_05890 [Myxococcota bacterium]